MKLGGSLSVLAHGMVTAVGFSGPATCAAMRAGISGIRLEKLWDYTAIDRLSAARPLLPQWWEGPDLLAELLAPAIEECIDAAAGLPRLRLRVPPDEIPILVLVAPKDRPHRFPGLDLRIADDLSHKLGRPLSEGSVLIPAGRTGLARALELIHESMRKHGDQLFVVAGAESYMRQSIVKHYIDEGRLLCAGNSNGFIPGEAACALLVGPTGSTAGPELVLEGVGRGREKSGAGGNADATVTGEGLTAAMREALHEANLQYNQMNFTLSDLNGERFKFKEAAIASMRLDRLRPEGSPPRPYGYVEVWHPIEFLGEIGAAISPCLLGWAFEAGKKGYAPGLHSLVFSGEDNGDRLAMVTRFKAGQA